MNKYISPVKTIAKYLLVIATVFAVLGNIVNWLTLYITGTGIGASHGATLTFSIVGFILGTTISSAVLFAIFSVATGLAFLLYAAVVNIRAKTKAPVNTPEQNSNAIKLALLALVTDVVLSGLIAVMSSSAMYAILSAISAKHGLILLDVSISGFLSFCLLVPGLGLIGAIAFLIFAFIAITVFGSSSSKKAKSKALSTVALLTLIALPLSMTGCAFDGTGGGGVIVIDPSPCGGFGCPLPPPYFPGGPGRHGGFGGYGGFGGGGQFHGGFNGGGNRNSGSHGGGRR
jgi:uncharacterized membrane protein YgcG